MVHFLFFSFSWFILLRFPINPLFQCVKRAGGDILDKCKVSSCFSSSSVWIPGFLWHGATYWTLDVIIPLPWWRQPAYLEGFVLFPRASWISWITLCCVRFTASEAAKDLVCGRVFCFAFWDEKSGWQAWSCFQHESHQMIDQWCINRLACRSGS